MSRALTTRGVTAYVPGYAPPVWAWMKRSLNPAPGERVDWIDLYNIFIAGWQDVPEDRRPTPHHFAQALKFLAIRNGIRIEIAGERVYFCDVRLIR